MDLKNPGTTEPAAPTIPKYSTDNTEISIKEEDIHYTPPSSTTSMTSTSMADPSKSANISVRTYIYFLPYPLPANTPVPYTTNLATKNPLNLPTTLFEPTSTLVLTSPNNTFVDLRFLKPLSPDQKTDELDWGFAGHSTSTPTSVKGTTHSTWTHFVDSRYPAGSSQIPIDEGDMYAISATLTLEHGHAFHPHLKAVASHEEMWEDASVLPTTAAASKARTCAVMRLCDDERGVRGVVVRLGQYVQGIVVMGHEVTAERWEWMDGVAGRGERGWRRTKRVGRQMLPCAVVTTRKGWSVGGKVRYGEFEWVVEEGWEW